MLGIGVVVLYDVSVHGLGILVLTALAATIGLAATGTLYGVLAAGLRLRETLLPLLLLPVLAPVHARGHPSLRRRPRGRAGDAWPWVALLGIFAVLYTAIGVLAFGSLWEEA